MFDGGFAESRLRFLEIDPETCEALRQAWPLIEPGLPGILTKFYDAMLVAPVPARILRTAPPIEHLKSAQAQHWGALFAGTFDAAYMERVRRVGLAHQRIGLEPRWYMGAYAYLLRQIVETLGVVCGSDRHRFVRLLDAVVKAVMLDMDLAVESYFVATQEAASRQVGELASTFEGKVKGTVDAVAAAARGLGDMSNAMAGAAVRARMETEMVAGSALEASSSVETVAAAAEELTASIRETGREATRLAAIASAEAKRADTAAHTVVGLTNGAHTIGGIVRLIGQIAQRSKILALNATIEAQRAGDAGKGFAVVASEVKALANETGRATGEISAEIATMQGVIADAAGAIELISGAISDMNASMGSIAAAVEQQGAATAEISRSVNRAASGTLSVSKGISTVSAAAAETGTLSTQLAGAAGDLSAQASRMAKDVADFLGCIRA